jgi:hypothetical protein
MDDTLFVSGYLGTGKASWKNGRYSPVYEITRGELSLFDYFDKYFTHLWNKSHTVIDTSPDTGPTSMAGW